jgi:hypothetical protein
MMQGVVPALRRMEWTHEQSETTHDARAKAMMSKL